MKAEFTTDKNILIHVISDNCSKCPFKIGYLDCAHSEYITPSPTEIPSNCPLRNTVYVYKLRDE